MFWKSRKRNPLIRRLPRELKNEIGKYTVLFLFIAGMIGVVSGFLVASESTGTACRESVEKYNVEDGNFELLRKADAKFLEVIQNEEIQVFENFYIEEETDDIDSKLRIFKLREEINKICLMEGEVPDEEDEIAIDRMYARNNEISVGDQLLVDGEHLTVSGLVALSDYSALFASSADMMFDAVKFGVAVMTEEGFDTFGKGTLHYCYSWKYQKAPGNESEAKEMAEQLLKIIYENAVITNFNPQFSNPAIQFAPHDIGRDNTMISIFLYIVVIIIAFIMAITTVDTIEKEAAVIGVLRASGYTKGELVRHYLTMPLCITCVAAVVGNILGYTVFKDIAATMYYATYSLPTYVALWNATAFLKTTVIPVLIMLVINLGMLAYQLKLSPLKFLRRDLRKKKREKTRCLSEKMGIMQRFRVRIILQNMPNYMTIVIGIFLANIALLFGIVFHPLLDKYEKEITSNMICDYQYVLKIPVKTKADGAERYCMGGLKTIEGRLRSEDVSVFGIQPDSRYVSLDLEENGVYISNAFAEKYRIVEGDTITLKEQYGEKQYPFKVTGIYDYPAGVAMFMSQKMFWDTFDCEEGFFNGYFSDAELTDIDEVYIATKITENDLTRTTRQLKLSMGSLTQTFFWFGILMFMLIIYLLSKIVIEKNAQSISMTKILGFTNQEISRLYIMVTSMVVIGSLIFTMPVVNIIMEKIFEVIFSQYPGWLPYYVPCSSFVKIAVAGVLSYAMLVLVQFRRVKSVPMDAVLKKVE